MRLAVVGAGVSGLSVARLAEKAGFSATVFERSGHIGGIAFVEDVDGINFHRVGGHCFNTKHREVREFVFEDVLPKSRWNLIERKAKIYFKENYISYPIEYSINEIAKFDKKLASEIVLDFMLADHDEHENLEKWFVSHFGEALAREYFIPYNRKIWGRHPESMCSFWVRDKLPIPSKASFVSGLFDLGKDDMPHASFYYPKSGSQMEFLHSLSKGLNIKFNSNVNSINFVDGKPHIDGREYDFLVNTGPLDTAHRLLTDNPDWVEKESSKLKYNKVTTMLWRTEELGATWTYYPEDTTPFHRIIHIGNFCRPKKNYSITEVVGVVPEDDMIKYGREIPYLLSPIQYSVSDYAYVVFDNNTVTSRKKLLDYFESRGIFQLGRFGQWEYFNMDICIKNAMEVISKLEVLRYD